MRVPHGPGRVQTGKQFAKVDMHARQVTDLSRDIDDDDPAPAPKPRTPKPAADPLATLTPAQRAAVVDALKRVRASQIAWNFVLPDDTDRTVLGLREVIWAECEAATAAEKERPSEAASQRLARATHAKRDWTKYVAGDHRGYGYRKRLAGKTLADYDPADPELDRTQKKKKKQVTTPADDDGAEGGLVIVPTAKPKATSGPSPEEDDAVVVTAKPKARRKGPPPDVTPQKAAAKAAKKVDVSELKAGKRVEPHPSLYTKKWKGRMSGGQPEWVRSVVEAAVVTKTPGNLCMLLTQMAYWAKPRGAERPPRASADRRVQHDGVWWFSFSPTDTGKEFRWPPRSVTAALDGLVAAGLAERQAGLSANGKYGPNTTFIRTRWEVVHHLLSVVKVMTPQEDGYDEEESRKTGGKSKKVKRGSGT